MTSIKRNFWLCLTVAVLFAVTPARSQEVVFKKVVPPLGNFKGTVGGIAQDKNGYIWIASHGDGLFKYDGHRFRVYTNNYSGKNSLSSNNLETVFADRDGMLWILTYVNGVDRFDPVSGSFTHFQHNPTNPKSLSSDTARAVLQDHEGTLWIGTNKGLDRYDPKTGTFQHYQHHPADPQSLSCDNVRKIYEDREGTLWIGTGSIWPGEGGETDAGGLNRFDPKTGTFTSYLHDPANAHSLINNKVQAIFEDSRGTFWVGTAGDGLHTMDRTAGTFERHLYDPAHPDKLSRPEIVARGDLADHITFITEDATKTIWIGTIFNGMSRYDPKTQKTVHFGSKDSASGFASNTAWTCFNSKDGILWISDFNFGLFRFDPYHKNIPHVAVNSPVLSFCEDNGNNFWIGTESGIMVQNQRTGVTTKYENNPADSNSLNDNVVLTLFRDRQGTIWIGTEKGLNRFNASSHTFTRYEYNPKDSSTIEPQEIMSICEADSNFLWIGMANERFNSSGGLSLLNKKTGTFTSFKHDPADTGSISRNVVSTMLAEPSGNLWIGTGLNGGLNYLDRKAGTFRHFLKDNEVSSLLKTGDGKLWVGTADGLFISSNSRDFTRFTTPGMDIEAGGVSSILEDDQNNIWIRTSTGAIYKINSKDKQAVNFGANSEMNGRFYFHSYYKKSSGELCFGYEGGYYIFSSGEVSGNPNPPQIIFTNFRLNGSDVSPGDNSPLSAPVEGITNLSLPHDENTFSIGLAASHFTSPENNRILYKLENYDPDWRDAGSDNVATYVNVPPGHYTLKVKAASSEGIWSEKQLTIIINPPWWRTWWAYCIYGLLLLSAIYLFDRFQRRRVIARERERTKEKELAQAREIEKAYTELKATQRQLIEKEKMASLGELTAGIAHEIQNPLNFVNNFTDVNKELLNEAKQELSGGHYKEVDAILGDIEANAEKIAHHGRRADSIVKGMLQHARASSGERQGTDINKLTDEYLRLSYQGMRAKDREFNSIIETSYDTTVGEVNIVAQDIGRVLLNLFNNAFYAVHQKKLQLNGSFEPMISVATKREVGHVTVTVKDNGTGIPEKVQDKIFQPFFTTKPTGEGTGLGLSLSYDIVTKGHGGTLSVQSERGEGSLFIVTLPLA